MQSARGLFVLWEAFVDYTHILQGNFSIIIVPVPAMQRWRICVDGAHTFIATDDITSAKQDAITYCAMMTSSNGNIFRVTGPLCGEFTGPGEFPTQRPVTRSFGVFFDLRPNKRLNKQWPGWWFETLSRPFWRHRKAYFVGY